MEYPELFNTVVEALNLFFYKKYEAEIHLPGSGIRQLSIRQSSGMVRHW